MDKELKEAAATIVRECKSHNKCYTCPFFDDMIRGCVLYHIPSLWDIDNIFKEGE